MVQYPASDTNVCGSEITEAAVVQSEDTSLFP